MNQKKVKALKKMFWKQMGHPPTRPEFKAFVKLLKDKGIFKRPLK